MEKSRLPELYCVNPAMAMIYEEMKMIVDRHKNLTTERREQANIMLREIADNTALIASDSDEDHVAGKCHCLVAIDLTEKLALFLREKEGETN